MLGDLTSTNNCKKSEAGDKIKDSTTGKLFSNTGSTNIFSNSTLFSSNPGTSLFGSTNNTNSLFGSSNNTNSLFGSKPLINFNNLAKDANSFLNSKKEKSDEEDDGEGADELFQGSNSPSGAYNPVEEKPKYEVNSIYTKKYVKQIDNVFVYNNEEKKYVSKGSGFLSLEYSDKENKKTGVLVFR